MEHGNVQRYVPVAMVKSKRDPPSDGAIIERAFSLANEAMFTIALQCRRLQCVEPEDQGFVFRWWADLQFLVIVLCRLRLAANIARKARGVSIDANIATFNDALPHLKNMQDVGEHIDEYAVDSSKRRIKKLDRRALQVGNWNGATFSWLVGDLVNEAWTAAEALSCAIRDARQRFIEKLS